MIRTIRKHPDSGYTVRHEKVGNICFQCANKKLNLKLDIVEYD